MKIKSLSSTQIALIMKKGEACYSGSFLFKTFEGFNSKESTPTLLGSFVLSKKNFKNAVDRNRNKRIFKEAFVLVLKKLEEKEEKTKIPSFVFVIKKPTKKIKFDSLVEEIRCFLLKNYIIK